MGRSDSEVAIRIACPSRRFMFGINRAIKGAFEQVTLGERPEREQQSEPDHEPHQRTGQRLPRSRHRPTTLAGR